MIRRAAAIRRRYGHARSSAEDRRDGQIADARLRAIEADPGRLVSIDDLVRKYGEPTSRG